MVRRSSFVVQADGTRAAAKWDAGTMSHFDHISLDLVVISLTFRFRQ
jgi:hypothetical protein